MRGICSEHGEKIYACPENLEALEHLVGAFLDMKLLQNRNSINIFME
jgi:hypothetical protein